MRRGVLSRTWDELPWIALYGLPGFAIGWVCCLAIYSLFVVPLSGVGYLGMVFAVILLFFLAKFFLREVVDSVRRICGYRRWI